MILEEMLTRSADLQDEILRLLEDFPTHPCERFEASMVACGVALEHAQALRILFMHGSIHPLRRHLEGYPAQLVLQVLRNSNGLMTMTGMLAAILTGNDCCINPMRVIQTKFKDCLPPLNPLAPQV